MEKKDTLSSYSDSEKQQMQLIEDKSKESCMVSFQRLHSHLKCLSNNDLKGSRTEDGFKRAFATLFGQDLETFTGTMFLYMDQLQTQLDNKEFQEIGSIASFKISDPKYYAYPKAEVQTSAKINIFATGQQHTEQPEFNNEGKVDQNAEQCHDIRPLPAKLTDNMTTKLSDQLLDSENVCLKMTVAQFQKDFGKIEAHCINLELQLQMENNVLKSRQHSQFLKEKGNEAKVKNDIDVIETINIELEHSVAKLLAENEQLHKEKEHLKQTYNDLFDSIKRTRIQKKGFAIAALKNELRKLTGNSVNTKFAKPSILGKPVGQPLKNQSVVRQPTAFKSERPRISKPRFASQVDVNNDLSKPVTTHHLPKGRESAPAKPHHMIAPSSSRYSSNDIVHNHYLEEAKKKTHEHSRIPRNFSDSKHFVCSTCQKCVFNANHDACVIKFLKEVNSRAKVPSNKTTNRNKPVEQIRVATKPKRQIPKGHRFSIKKTTTVHEKTTSPRSCLRWQPTGRILKTVCLRWVPTGKTFASSTTKVESEPPNGSNADIPNQCESEQALNVSAGTLLSTAVQASVVNVKWCLLKITLQAPFLNVQKTFDRSRSSLGHQCLMTSDHNRSELGIQDHNNEHNAEDNRQLKNEQINVCDKGSKERKPSTQLKGRETGHNMLSESQLIADIEMTSWTQVMQMQQPFSAYSGSFKETCLIFTVIDSYLLTSPRDLLILNRWQYAQPRVLKPNALIESRGQRDQ
ncbi:hypothetical protein Tco_0748606 [Tanacetum coccineum]|uniref:Uncharacterized protein n=1 Tax=Tanacetum coccineum TaxID=301880 RepID=A0ABQ4YWB3_9ASTR